MFLIGTHKDKLKKLLKTMTFGAGEYRANQIAQAQDIIADFLPKMFVAKTTKIVQNIQRPSDQEWFFAVDNKSREPIKHGGKCTDRVIQTIRERLFKVMMNDQRKVRGLQS